MTKTTKVQIGSIPRKSAYVFLPIGLYCNKKIKNLSAGSIIEFCESWRRDKVILVRKCVLPTSSSVFTFLLKSIYGEDATWQKLSEEWRARCVIEGLGKDAFDPENVLLLEVKNYVKVEYEAEQERIRQAEEREKRLAEIKAGTYRHKDIIY